MDEEAKRSRRAELSDPNLPYDVVWEIMQDSASSLEVYYINLASDATNEKEEQSFYSELDRVQKIKRNYNLTREELLEHTITLEEELKSVGED